MENFVPIDYETLKPMTLKQKLNPLGAHLLYQSPPITERIVYT